MIPAYNSVQVGSLSGTFSSLNCLPSAERQQLLDQLLRVAEAQFDGTVERNMLSAIYVARKNKPIIGEIKLSIEALARLRRIPTLNRTQFPRGGAYDPDTNVWICNEFAEIVAETGPEQTALWQGFALTAFAAGALHRRQLQDNQAGHIWPTQWIQEKNGNEIVAFCHAHPEAATPYTCLNDAYQITPYSAFYQQELSNIVLGLDALLQCGARSAMQQAPYLAALKEAYTFDPNRRSDLALMNRADEAWVEIAADVPYLIMCEFSENYSDPLKRLVLNQAVVSDWATAVSHKNGLGPWRSYFEFRVLGRVDDAVTPDEIAAIRATNRALYLTISDFVPSTHVKTEFRRAIITGGHGANPPKSAKNYPNQSWIRRDQGYRNVIFANQLEEKTRREAIPALRAALPTAWARSDAFIATTIRASAVKVVAHEETHPWAIFHGITWMEEMKADLLGMYSVMNSPTIDVEIADLLVSSVAADLLLHRYHHFLVSEKNDTQFEDYHIGGTILLTYLLRGGFFKLDAQGMVVDIERSVAGQLIEQLAQRIMAIKAGQESHNALYDELFDAEQVYQRFRGWSEHQAYFEDLWR